MSLFLVSAKKENTKDLKLGINRPSVSKKETIDENVKVESSIAKEETSTVKEVTTAEEKKNIAEFKKDIISNGVYINLNGSLESVTESNLKDLEKKIKNPVIYDMSKDGKMIKVLSDSIEKAEGDK
ncbi:hypothetical protein [Pseudolactococcus chungangensis]|uniref:hypothetical protein n=1 Tax=Pseudolactococcus chungangensis TaxID=451457 RepID=UPI003FA1D537